MHINYNLFQHKNLQGHVDALFRRNIGVGSDEKMIIGRNVA